MRPTQAPKYHKSTNKSTNDTNPSDKVEKIQRPRSKKDQYYWRREVVVFQRQSKIETNPSEESNPGSKNEAETSSGVIEDDT